MKSNKRYSAEFKAQAVELASLGKPVAQVAEELGISGDLIYSWRKSLAKAQNLGSAGEGAVGDQSEADEILRLRRANAQLTVENDILKKAAVILGTKNPYSSAK